MSSDEDKAVEPQRESGGYRIRHPSSSRFRASGALEQVDEVSLADLIAVTWRLRGQIVLVTGICLGLAALIIALLLIILPTQTAHRLPFRINFPGVIENQYPNGLRFQPADIVAPTVMHKVYAQQKLADLLDFEDFKASFSVREFNEELESIRLEYQAKLANTKLTQAERSALEEEYAARRKAARTGEFELVYISQQPGGLSEELVGQVMNAILGTWAEEAQREKGAYLYDIPVLTERSYDKGLIASTEYITSLDMIRQAIKRLQNNVTELQEIPGINLVRIEDDEVGLAEVRLWLEDLQRFQVDPLIGRVRANSAHKDLDAALGYIRDQLFNLNLDVEAMRKNAQAISDVLQAYQGTAGIGQNQAGGPTVAVPQVGEGFLDRLMDLSVKSRDVQFRRELVEDLVRFKSSLVELEREQAFYRSMDELLEGGRNPSSSSVDKDAENWTKKVADEFAHIVAQTDQAVRALNAIYRKASQQSLQPAQAFTVTGPLEVSKGLPLGLAKLVLILAAGGMLAGLVSVVLVVFRLNRAGRFDAR